MGKLYSYELKTSAPKWPVRRGLILEYKKSWGEIAPLPGFSDETLEEAKREVLSLLKNLPKATPKLPSVKFGVRSALRKFSTKPLKIPMSLLNEPQEGFSSMKLKLGHLSVEDAIKMVKQFVGSYRLRLDCNRSWSLDEAIHFTKHFHPDDFDYLEEPVLTYSDLVRFSEITRFPVAVDESIKKFTCSEIPTLKAAVIKPTIVGSLPLVKAPIVLSSAFESSLGLLQIARLYREGSPPAGLDTFRFFQEDLLDPPLRAEQGYLIWDGTRGCPINMSKLKLEQD